MQLFLQRQIWMHTAVLDTTLYQFGGVSVKLLEGISTKIAHASPGLQDTVSVIKKKKIIVN